MAAHAESIARLEADELTWSEIGDAVWLTSVTRDIQRHPETDAQAGEAEQRLGEPLPTDGPPPPYQVATERGVDNDVEPPAGNLVDGPPAPAWHLLAGRPALPRSTATPIPDSAAIIRALRPLKRKVPSWRADDVVFDEVATAERAAHDRLWWPVTRPGRRRWLDLTLVVDGGPSMALWRARVGAFVSLIEQLGAFRTIQVRLLDTHHQAGELRAVPLLRGGTADAPARSAAEVLDPSGRRMVLVVTDGVGESWRQDVVSPMLARWGRAMPVAVVNLLPQRLWGSGGLAVQRARLTVPAALRPNGRWGLELSDAWLEQDSAAAPDGAVPVPVLELRPRWLGWWARLITRAHRGPADATVLLAGDKPREPARYNVPGGPSVHERVDTFRSLASPAAVRLASLLASVPVTLPVARLVQAALVPESGPEHLAEVFTSGLLHPAADGDQSNWDTCLFELPEAARELLLSGARRADTARVVRVAAERFGDQLSVLGRLRDAIAAPDNIPDPELTPETAADIALERVVMRALSGPYLSRADRLSQAIMREPEPERREPSSTTAIAKTESDNMPNTAERADRPNDSGSTSSPAPAPEIRPVQWDDAEDAVAITRTGPPFTLGTAGFRERQADDAPPVWGNVPPRNLNFTGRAELLDQLSMRLTAGGTTVVLPAALYGMGGIGKTQMAVEYIYRHLHDYDIIWWIQAAQPTQIRAGLTELARQLRLPGSAEASTAVPAVREALRLGQPFRNWLLVFDAAESPDVVRPFFPTNGPGEILITSRNPDWAGIARPLEVSVFKRDESKELLLRRGPEITDEDADQLADKLGDLPLAIEQAAAWRAETGMPVREYLRLFDEKVAEILDTSAPPDYELSVAAAWNVSFDELRTRNPAAHQILHICAFFAPEPISRDLFTGVRGVSISPELDVALRDPIQLGRAIRDINRYGLAKIDHGTNTLLLHRLVQLVLRNRMTPPHLQAQMRHGAHLLLANLDPNDPESGRNWLRYRELLPHAYAADVVDCDDSWVRQLVINLMRFLFQWGDHEEAALLAQRALADWSARLGPTDPQALEVAWRLGIYLWSLGRYTEAAELNQRTLELRVQTSGENSEETLGVQANVLADLKAKGDFAAARQLSEEIYRKSRKLFGEDDPETLEAAYLHAISLRITGDFRAARALAEDTYTRRIELLGHDHRLTYNTYVGLTVDRREAGDYVWARVELEKLTEMARQHHGEEALVTWLRSYQLAVARRKDGDHTNALALSSAAIEYFHRRYGEDHPNSMACALAHSIDLRHSGDLAEARRLGERTFDKYRRSLGEHHPYTLSATVDLSVTLRLLGETAESRQLDERALEHLRAGLGPDHPSAIVSAVNLASDLAAVGESEPALALGAEALDRARRALGPDHPTTLAAAVNLVFDLRTADRAQEAEARYADVMAGYRRVLGEAHPATITAARGIRANCDIDPPLL